MNLYTHTLRITPLYIVVLLSGFLTKAQGESLITIYSESFEEGLGNFSQDTTDSFDWTRKSGATSTPDTGPDSASEGSFYVYTETSSRSTGQTAVLNLNSFSLGSVPTQLKLKFMYNLYSNPPSGFSYGSINLEVYSSDSWISVWKKTNGINDKTWQTAEVDLTSYIDGNEISLRFKKFRGTGPYGDTAIDKFEILVNSESLSISDFSGQRVALYPNPAQTELQLAYAQDTAVSYTVYDLTGRQLATHQARGTTHSLDISSLPTGNYLLQAKQGKARKSFSFIKK